MPFNFSGQRRAATRRCATAWCTNPSPLQVIEAPRFYHTAEEQQDNARCLPCAEAINAVAEMFKGGNPDVMAIELARVLGLGAWDLRGAR